MRELTKLHEEILTAKLGDTLCIETEASSERGDRRGSGRRPQPEDRIDLADIVKTLMRKDYPVRGWQMRPGDALG